MQTPEIATLLVKPAEDVVLKVTSAVVGGGGSGTNKSSNILCLLANFSASVNGLNPNLPPSFCVRVALSL